MTSSSIPFDIANSTAATAAAATAAATTAVQIPQWAIDVHNFRTRLFLAVVEPVIVYLLGPLEIEDDEQTTLLEHNIYNQNYPHNFYSSDPTISSTTTDYYDYHYNNTGDYEYEGHDDPRRRLGFLPNYVEDVSAFRETSMSFATLTMLFTIMTCVMIVFLSCFYHNQQTSPLFSSPRRHRLPRLVPPPLPVDGTFSWIKVCFYMSDEELINRVGFDALIFIRFHRLSLRCIVKMSVFSFIVLLPLNFTGGGHANASDIKGYVGSLLFTDFLRFSMANVSGGSPRLWVHCVAAYVLTGIVMRELVVEYNAFNNIRHRYMLSKEPHLRTVLVTNIPKHLRSPKKIRNYFKHLYPNAVKNVTMCQNLIHLERLVLQRNNVLDAIEKEILMLCRSEKRKMVASTFERSCACVENISIVGDYQDRLTILYSRLEEMNGLVQKELKRRYRVMKKLDKMEAKKGRKDIDYILATPYFDNESIGIRGTAAVERKKEQSIHHITQDNSISMEEKDIGFHYENFDDDDGKKQKSGLRPFARTKQAIKRYSRSVMDKSLLSKPNVVNREKLDIDGMGEFDTIENHSNEVTDKAFVEMKTFTASTVAIQSMHSSKPGAMDVSMAPEPRDVLWQNIYVAKGARRTRGYIGETLVILLISFYAVPVALISLLVSESALISTSPRLAQLDQASAFFSSALAMVQPICLVIIQQLLPPLFMQISKAEGLTSFSEAQMRAFSRYFMFQVLNVFLVTAIAGSIFDTIAIIVENPEAAFEMLGNSLPRMSSFFITLVTMKTFLGLGVELVRFLSIVQSLIRFTFMRNATLRKKKTPFIALRAIDDPGWFPFHKILAQDMLVVVISVVFAVVAPIVLMPCALFCLVSRILWTHHHLYIYESVFESGGQFWPKVFRRFVFGLIIAQMTITGQFFLKEARHEAYATIALMFITYVFLRSTRSRYDGPSSTLPLEVATIMDITVEQEEEAKRRDKGLTQPHDLETSPSGCHETKETDFDPFEHAYCQPSLRANPLARPEQPFPPSQLGKEDIFMDHPSNLDLNFKDVKEGNDKATVRLKSLNERDRTVIDHWWNQQFQAAGKQNFVSVLIGEESGKLRLGRKPRRNEKRHVV